MHVTPHLLDDQLICGHAQHEAKNPPRHNPTIKSAECHSTQLVGGRAPYCDRPPHPGAPKYNDASTPGVPALCLERSLADLYRSQISSNPDLRRSTAVWGLSDRSEPCLVAKTSTYLWRRLESSSMQPSKQIHARTGDIREHASGSTMDMLHWHLRCISSSGRSLPLLLVS